MFSKKCIAKETETGGIVGDEKARLTSSVTGRAHQVEAAAKCGSKYVIPVGAAQIMTIRIEYPFFSSIHLVRPPTKLPLRACFPFDLSHGR